MDSSSQVQRPIELQAPEDFSYLIDNVRKAAADSINAAFPPVGDGDGNDDHQEDELRVRIEQMVNDYITQTFTLVAPNVTINGLPVDPAHFLSSSSSNKKNSKTPQEIEAQYEYEPFDPRKRARLEDLAREEEDLLRSIASLKRRVPAQAAANWAQAMKSGIAADEAALAVARGKVEAPWVEAEKEGGKSAPGKKGILGVVLPPPPHPPSAALTVVGGTSGGGDGATGAGDEGGEEEGGQQGQKEEESDEVKEWRRKQADMESGFARAVEALGRLKRDMPATVAKMERARVAGGYVVTGR